MSACVGLTGLRSRHVRRIRSAGSDGTRVKALLYCGGTWTTRYRRPASDIDSITRLVLHIPGDRAPIAEKRPFDGPLAKRAGVSHAAHDSRLRASSRKPSPRQVPSRLPITNVPLAARPLEWCRTLSIGTVALTRPWRVGPWTSPESSSPPMHRSGEGGSFAGESCPVDI